MTTYTAIPNGDVDQDSPVTQPLLTLLRDNPIAITEGASGAPRIAFEALDTWYTTAGAIGTYVLAKRASGTTDVAFGSTLAGSSLVPAGAISAISSALGNTTPASGAALSGTWRAMGELDHSATGSGGGNTIQATLWLRIS